MSEMEEIMKKSIKLLTCTLLLAVLGVFLSIVQTDSKQSATLKEGHCEITEEDYSHMDDEFVTQPASKHPIIITPELLEEFPELGELNGG